MTSIINQTLEIYNAIYDYDGDPNAAKWPLIKSPLPVVSIAIIYLIFVLKVGPALMKNRAPIQLNGLLITYNGLLVLANIAVSAIIFMADGGFVDLLSSCHNPYTTFYTYARSCGAWWFFMSKIFELFDTLFMILRKKHSQISFFHVFHHVFTILYVWSCLKFLPGVQCAFHSLFNSSVHVMMYTYYMLAAMGPSLKKYLWWKKYLTLSQLAQFITVLIYIIYVIVMDCNFSKALTYYEFFNCLLFIYLFLDFYSKAYSGSKKKESLNKKKD